VLSGKYTRANKGKVEADRGAWATSALTDKAYDIIDELQKIARELDTTPAAAALAWVQGRPDVASTIIGARTLRQLEDNLKALDVRLSGAHVESLDRLSEPTLDFPAGFLKRAGMFTQGGTTVNGEAAEPWPMTPRTDAERY
jgi:aryl-alcohol dehydrogenase-like predicted oxidoreductase